MPNPYLPLWEHIPDAEPHRFGDRVYVYGSHDRPASDSFCDALLKVWSADVRDLEHWVCHGEVFRSQAGGGRPSSAPWLEGGMCYAPDAACIRGRYYLFVYLFYGRGCVAVSDRPEGPFDEVHPYTWGDSGVFPEGVAEGGVLVDPGVLVDDDGRVYVYGGFERSWMAQVDPERPWRVLPETYRADILPAGAPFDFYEACSPRKIGGVYYLVYSPRRGSRLAYATAPSPEGPFTYRGVIVDNGDGYPGGNDHGGLVCLGGRWAIFYHRTSNGSVYSRQACAEWVDILPDGSIPQVRMTSQGLGTPLDPYEVTTAHRLCMLRGGLIKHLNPLQSVLAGLKDGSVFGFRSFDFGPADGGTPLRLHVGVRGTGETGLLRVRLDDPDRGEELACLPFGCDDAILTAEIRPLSGVHEVYFAVEDPRRPADWAQEDRARELLQVTRFVFTR